MGAKTSSVNDQNINKEIQSISKYHSDISLVYNNIMDDGNKIITDIQNNGYLDNNNFCNKIGYLKAKELSDSFPIQTLQGVQYKIGIIPESTPLLNQNKLQICQNIINFFQSKVNAINKIKSEIPKCIKTENDIWNELSRLVDQNEISINERNEVYKRVDTFNKEILYRYNQIKNNLDRIKNANTKNELDSIINTTYNLLDKTIKMCEDRKLLFSQYSKKMDNEIYDIINMNEPDEYEALYNYRRQNDDELDLNIGDIVTSEYENQDEWIYAKNRQGNEGYVPLNYLRKINYK